MYFNASNSSDLRISVTYSNNVYPNFTVVPFCRVEDRTCVFIKIAPSSKDRLSMELPSRALKREDIRSGKGRAYVDASIVVENLISPLSEAFRIPKLTGKNVLPLHDDRTNTLIKNRRAIIYAVNLGDFDKLPKAPYKAFHAGMKDVLEQFKTASLAALTGKLVSNSESGPYSITIAAKNTLKAHVYEMSRKDGFALETLEDRLASHVAHKTLPVKMQPR